MRFDLCDVTKIILTCPPRNMTQCLQEIGRAGRRGQSACAVLYFNNKDIGRNLPGIKTDIIEYCKNDSNCLRNQLLSVFGFTKDMSKYAMLCKCCSICKEKCDCSFCQKGQIFT